jgi:hypothetical protein
MLVRQVSALPITSLLQVLPRRGYNWGLCVNQNNVEGFWSLLD